MCPCFPCHLLSKSPYANTTDMHAQGTFSFLRNSCESGNWAFLRGVSSRESPDSLVDTWGPLEPGSAPSLTSSLSVLHIPSVQSPKFLYSPFPSFVNLLLINHNLLFGLFLAFSFHSHHFCILASPEALFLSHLLCGGHGGVCLLWARCYSRSID